MSCLSFLFLSLLMSCVVDLFVDRNTNMEFGVMMMGAKHVDITVVLYVFWNAWFCRGFVSWVISWKRGSGERAHGWISQTYNSKCPSTNMIMLLFDLSEQYTYRFIQLSLCIMFEIVQSLSASNCGVLIFEKFLMCKSLLLLPVSFARTSISASIPDAKPNMMSRKVGIGNLMGDPKRTSLYYSMLNATLHWSFNN